MVAKFIQSDQGLAMLVDPQLIRLFHLTVGSEAEVSTNGQGWIVSPIQYADDATFERALDETEAQYDGVFRKLAE